jgi:hypothetical protein
MIYIHPPISTSNSSSQPRLSFVYIHSMHRSGPVIILSIPSASASGSIKDRQHVHSVVWSCSTTCPMWTCIPYSITDHLHCLSLSFFLLYDIWYAFSMRHFPGYNETTWRFLPFSFATYPISPLQQSSQSSLWSSRHHYIHAPRMYPNHACFPCPHVLPVRRRCLYASYSLLYAACRTKRHIPNHTSASEACTASHKILCFGKPTSPAYVLRRTNLPLMYTCLSMVRPSPATTAIFSSDDSSTATYVFTRRCGWMNVCAWSGEGRVTPHLELGTSKLYGLAFGLSPPLCGMACWKSSPMHSLPQANLSPITHSSAPRLLETVFPA